MLVCTIECYNIEKNEWMCLDEYPKNIWEHSMDLLYIPKCRYDDMEVIFDDQRNHRDTTVSCVPAEATKEAVAGGAAAEEKR
jgi:hypothetical protein